MDIGKTLKFMRVENAAAAGQTTLTSEYVDTAGYDGVIFIVLFGSITSGGAQSVKALQATASNGSDGADLEGSSTTVADSDDNKIVVVDVYRPRERYVAVAALRATQDSVVDGIVAFLYSGSKAPVTNDTTVVGLKSLISPSEGTA